MKIIKKLFVFISLLLISVSLSACSVKERFELKKFEYQVILNQDDYSLNYNYLIPLDFTVRDVRAVFKYASSIVKKVGTPIPEEELNVSPTDAMDAIFLMNDDQNQMLIIALFTGNSVLVGIMNKEKDIEKYFLVENSITYTNKYLSLIESLTGNAETLW